MCMKNTKYDSIHFCLQAKCLFLFVALNNFQMVEKNAGLFWDDWNNSSYEAWSEIILHGLCCIIIVFLLIFGIYLVFYGTKQNNSTKNISTDIRFYRYLLASLLVSIIYTFYTYFIGVLSITVLGWRPKLGCLYRQIVIIPFI